MSPDNWKSNPIVKRIIETSSSLSAAFPHLSRYLVTDEGSFRGLSMFIGDTAEVVVGLRIFGEDGSPLIMWSSGSNPLEALMNLDRAVSSGNFKVDKKAMS